MTDPTALPVTGPAAAPLDLPRLVMRRASVVGLAVLVLALVLGLLRMNEDIDREIDAAMALAGLVARLGSLAQADDRDALAALRRLQGERPLRHLELRVAAGDGRWLLVPPPLPAVPAPLGWLLAWHRELLSAPDHRQVSWTVARPGGMPWTVTLAASHDGERREAMSNLVDMLLLLLAGVVGLLLVMRWNMVRAFAPLGRLLEAIAGIERPGARAAVALPTMPIRELEVVAAALRHLDAALASAEAQRRLLSQQVLTLQEDERARLAGELHDEFGQRLTALRVDAAWLARRLADQPTLAAVVDGMARQCEHVQGDIASLLARLQPFGPERRAGDRTATDDSAAAGESLARLVALLRALVAAWAAPGREPATAWRLVLTWTDERGADRPWPQGEEAEALRLSRSLLLTVYRISQEALTNVARHAGARSARLELHCRGRAAPNAALRLAWSVSDDGCGLGNAAAAMRRGNGIAGVQQRVWAQGAELSLADADPGLRLAAEFHARLLGALAPAAAR